MVPRSTSKPELTVFGFETPVNTMPHGVQGDRRLSERRNIAGGTAPKPGIPPSAPHSRSIAGLEKKKDVIRP